MARVLRMPGVAADATDAVLSDWLVAEAASFAAGDPVATVETDKAAVDIEAEAPGRMLRTLVPEGARVEVGEPIAVLGDPGEEVADLDALLASLGVAVASDALIPERREVPDPTPLVAVPAPAAAPDAAVPAAAGRARAGGRILASPLVRRLAGEAGVPLETLVGSGPHGRIVRRDLEAVLTDRPGRRPVAPPAVAAPAASAAAAYDEIPHTRLRRAIARRLAESKQAAPHFYLRATVRVGELVALRRKLNEDGEARVSLNDLIVKAVAVAHARVPEMNVAWTDDAVRRYRTVDVALAVATDRGLVTPVVRDVTSLTVGALAGATRELAERARAGRLQQDELEGGTITVTNLGMYGVEEFAAIINPPHAAILAVGATRTAPVVDDGAVVSAELMSLTLSVDHRPVDGVIAARWLGVLVELLEDPVPILR